MIKNISSLEQTAVVMLSGDYKERFVAEYFQVKYRAMRLAKMLDDYHTGKLNFTPTCPIDLLEKQLKVMCEYQDILKERAALEDVDISE